jgi:hypothetical protein
MKRKHEERIKDLYAMIDGIPASRIALEDWRQGSMARVEGGTYTRAVKDDALLNDCRTLACAVGWACAYPKFNEQGLVWDMNCPLYVPLGRTHCWSAWDAVSQFFGLSKDKASDLFSDNLGYYDVVAVTGVGIGPGPKNRMLHRLRNLMVEERIITPGRSNELRRLEGEKNEA